MNRLSIILYILILKLSSLCAPNLRNLCHETVSCPQTEVRSVEACVKAQQEAYASMTSEEKEELNEQYKRCRSFEGCELGECMGLMR